MNEVQYNQLATKQDIQEVLVVIRDLMEHIDARFTALEKRMGVVEKRLDSIEGHLDSIEERLIIERKDSANLQHWAHKASKRSGSGLTL